jgi:hypothetical protein
VFSARRVLHGIAAEVLGADAARAVRATSHRKVPGAPRRAPSGGGRERERERGGEVRPARPRASAARSA